MKLHRDGLSMIELVIVILVIGLMAAVATPRFSESLRATQLEAAAQQLAAHIRYLRSVAINEGRSVNLICDNTQATYRSDSVDFPERLGDLLFVSLPDDYDPTFALNATFDSATTMSFDFEGTPYVGATPMSQGRVTLRSGDFQFRVTIASGTGATTVTRVTRTVTDSESALGEAMVEMIP